MIVPSTIPGLGYGGAAYGYSPYSSYVTPSIPVAISYGYGGYAYGYSSYGSTDNIPPEVSSGASLSGYQIELFFSEPMQINADLTDPDSYTITPLIGAPVTVLSVAVGVVESSGASSVLLTTSGTTLGGRYTVTAIDSLVDIFGNLILPTARSVTFLSLGAVVSFSAVSSSGTTVLLDFSENLLSESEFSPGVESIPSYGTSSTYPVDLVITEIEHPVSSDSSKVLLTVEGMTSASYEIVVSPAEALSYDGSHLPSVATTFSGSSVGTGTSTAGSLSGLLLSKAAGVIYGWDFLDTSGKLIASSSFRVDVSFNAGGAVYTPALNDTTLGTILISDGAVQVSILLTRVAGSDILEVSSGLLFSQVPVVWSSSETVISLIRNQKAGHYAVLVNDVPLVSVIIADVTGVPTISSGVRFSLSSDYAVTQFPILGVSVTSSQTIFSESWNFLHGVSFIFVGSSASTRPQILTKRGPLVKDWGDPTPATIDDVEVRVNGTPVEISAVNPYLGLITPTVPIPLSAVGATTVEVDYVWFPNPALAMPGLNTLGVVLNKWDLHQGWHPPAASPIPSTSLGVPDIQRFPMGLVLGPLNRPQPILIGHRYIGFEKEYTAALNSPTTLLLNQNPHRIARDTLSNSPTNISISYDGDESPSGLFVLEGEDTGSVGTDGFYTLIDASSGSYGVGEAALYSRSTDYSFPSSVNMAVRLQITDWVSDGVFTGVGFGLHNNKFLYLVGFLEINGVKHIGLIKDATRPYLQASWTIGFALQITITSSTTFTVTGLSQTGLERFQIFDGAQAGIYTVADCGVVTVGSVSTVTINETFPAPFNRWGNNKATAYIEVPWDERDVTYRIVANVETGAVQVYVGGSLSGLAISSSKVSAFPAQTVLLLPTDKQGSSFWGSVSRKATNTSRWGFVKYGVTYDQATFHFQGIVVAAEMSDLPESDDNHEWFITEDFGYSLLEGTELLLKSTTNSTDIDTSFGYGRLEPFLTNQTLIDVDATFRMDNSILGAGDAQIQIQNGERSVLFSSIMYTEGGSPFRRLVQLPAVSITGIRDPVTDGWSIEGSGLVQDIQELPLTLIQTDGVSQFFYDFLDTTSVDLTERRIAEARIRIVSFTGLSVNNGPIFGCTAGPLYRDVALQFLTDQVRLVTRDAPLGSTWHGVGAAISFTWDDDAFHTYRVISDPTSNTVVVLIDDVVYTSVALTGFQSGGGNGRAYFGAIATSASTESEVDWESFSVQSLPAGTVKRTLGVFKNGGDPLDINGWEIPRTDSSTADNDSVSAVVEEMDWRSDIQVRVRLDPGWGATVFRPDLPPPPYYTGEFSSQFTEPSAGWINVEYRHLPRLTGDKRFGRVFFGALNPLGISQQRWSEVRYRIYTRSNEDFIAPQHMVLNWCNVITSGELLNDVGVEVIAVESITDRLVSLIPTHIYADRVFNLTVNDVVLDSSDWTFDVGTQAIILSSPLPSQHTTVTVSFAAGHPVTNTYICSQPLLQSNTLLNEGTPPVPMSQVGTATRQEVFGSALNDPTDTLGDIDFILNDPFRTVEFADDASVLYEALEFCTVDNGGVTGQIASISDGPAPEEGWIEVALSGTMFSNAFSLPGGPKATGGSNVLQDTVGGFSQTSILRASGGHHLGPVLGGGTLGGGPILYPSYPAIAGPDRGAVIRSMTMRMRLSSVLTDPLTEVALEDVLSSPSTDNDPPTSADPLTDPNPSIAGAGNGNGACAATLVDAVTTTYSRIGPWGGEAALAIRSQLSGGGYPASGNGFILSGGAALGGSLTVTVINVQSAN